MEYKTKSTLGGSRLRVRGIFNPVTLQLQSFYRKPMCVCTSLPTHLAFVYPWFPFLHQCNFSYTITKYLLFFLWHCLKCNEEKWIIEVGSVSISYKCRILKCYFHQMLINGIKIIFPTNNILSFHIANMPYNFVF
jgi:hypothetical protein